MKSSNFKPYLNTMLLTTMWLISLNNHCVAEVKSSTSFFLAYPPDNHHTNADSIFFIGSNSQGEVKINGKIIERSNQGFFAPSFPLQVGENKFTIRSQNQEITRTIIKLSPQYIFPKNLGFAQNSLTPNHHLARLPNESICFTAIAPISASNVSVNLADQKLVLSPLAESVELPPNYSVLISQNQPRAMAQNEDLDEESLENAPKSINVSLSPKIELKKGSSWQNFKGCTSFNQSGIIDNTIFELTLNNRTIQQPNPVQIEILNPDRLPVIQIKNEMAIARTGPSSDYARLTPLPQGTKASVTGKEGDWLRLDYGGWVKAEETELLTEKTPPTTIIKSINSRALPTHTEISFPLQNQVPISIKQNDDQFSLTLYNTIAQTDTIRFDDNILIRRLDWRQTNPSQVEYTFNLKSKQQWGYTVRYDNTTLILSIKNPPQLSPYSQNLQGVTIVIDPGHGGDEMGAIGLNGIPEKEINLIIAKLLKEELTARGALVYLTRETDQFISLADRTNFINKVNPTLALSIHYNSLPDGGDAIKTKGVGMFWYHPQAHDLAIFLHNYLVQKLDRPSYGVFWNNLALTRPTIAPSLLLELGFMINPDEFEWVINSEEQKKLSLAIANGVTEWLINSGR